MKCQNKLATSSAMTNMAMLAYFGEGLRERVVGKTIYSVTPLSLEYTNEARWVRESVGHAFQKFGGVSNA